MMHLVALAHVYFRGGEADAGGNLLGLAEIGVGDLFQALALQRHDALIAVHVAALVDGHGERAVAEQRAGLRCAGSFRRFHRRVVETGIGADAAAGAVIDDQHIDGAVGAGLQDEASVELQRGAEQHGEHGGFGEQPGDRRGIGVAGEDRVDDRAHLDDPAAHVDGRDLEWPHRIVACGSQGFAGLLDPHRHAFIPPRQKARMPFCACRRFSASSKTTEAGPSITASVTSSPRWAGRQCMKSAPSFALAISLALT